MASWIAPWPFWQEIEPTQPHQLRLSVPDHWSKSGGYPVRSGRIVQYPCKVDTRKESRINHLNSITYVSFKTIPSRHTITSLSESLVLIKPLKNPNQESQPPPPPPPLPHPALKKANGVSLHSPGLPSQDGNPRNCPLITLEPQRGSAHHPPTLRDATEYWTG